MDNLLRTGLLMAALTALLMIVGYWIGGTNGTLVAFLIAAATNVWSFWNADTAVLSWYNAQPVDARQAPALVRLVDSLAARAGLPPPKVYIINSDQPNAFATGRDPAHAAVAVNTGLLQVLSEPELAGVLAHELTHVRNRDTLTMTITATLAGAIGTLANLGMFMRPTRGDGRNGGVGAIGALLIMVLAPLTATPPTAAAPRSPVSRWRWPARCARSTASRGRCRTQGPNGIPRPPTCSSSTRWQGSTSTACSPRIHRWNNASRDCRRWPDRRRRYRTAENDVGARIWLVTRATIAPFASVCARAASQSGSAMNAFHFRSRSASESQASR